MQTPSPQEGWELNHYKSITYVLSKCHSDLTPLFLRYTPSEITVKLGDTLRIEAKNSGKTMHEIVLGTMNELKAHSELMKKHPDREHGDPYMAHVAPGKTEHFVWQFTKPGEFYYGCLIPGHFEAGMIGKVIVK